MMHADVSLVLMVTMSPSSGNHADAQNASGKRGNRRHLACDDRSVAKLPISPEGARREHHESERKPGFSFWRFIAHRFWRQPSIPSPFSPADRVGKLFAPCYTCRHNVCAVSNRRTLEFVVRGRNVRDGLYHC